MNRLMGDVIFAGFITVATASAQTWPDFHLTNGTHYTSYGVEDYDPENPIKNLYIDPVAILKAGSTELDNIYDGNQVFLNGGEVYATAIDANDFTWNSGNLYLEGGTYSTSYGVDSGSGKDLWVGEGTVLNLQDLNAPSSGNRFLLYGGKLSVENDLNASMDGFYFTGGTLEVGGALTGTMSLGVNPEDHEWGLHERHLILNGSAATWSQANRIGWASWGENEVKSVIVSNGATLNGGYIDTGGSIEVVGAESRWNGGSWSTEESSNEGRLLVSNGGVVTSVSVVVGDYYSRGNSVRILGEGSRWNISDGVTVGQHGGEQNQLVISDGGVVSSSSGKIGGFRGGWGNSIEVSGGGSQWNNSGELIIGFGSAWNSLVVSDGGVVTSSGAQIGLGADYVGYGNSITVSGIGSRWNNSGTLAIGYVGDSNYGNMLTISNGGEAVLKSGVTIHGTENSLNLEQDGRLTIGTDFDASMLGFNYNSGSTLAVEGQLSGLSTLETGCRLETPNVLGDLTVLGIFAPGNSPADSIVNGTLTMDLDGTLEMELGGYALGPEYDRLTVTGASMLGGTLDILFFDSFSPTNGASFDLFNWDGGISGGSEFENINKPLLSGGLEWDTSDLYTSGTLSVIPEPSVAALMGVFGGGLWVVVRRGPFSV